MSAAVLAIVLAFVTIVGTYVTNVYLSRRQERLARVNEQLGEFYGPLLAALSANGQVFGTWKRHVRPDGRSMFAADGPAPTEAELAEWRLWFTTAFLPNVQRARQVIVSRADLLIEPSMPPVLLELCAHVTSCEILVARWAASDLTDQIALIRYPAGALDYASTSFATLKRRQAQLLGDPATRRLFSRARRRE
ncbi:hypothetical protein OHA72_46705 [Dactylosporangium sp. NBC_01737]|uniref:hypothetical protein n=1 Tax=Dactylosporangium sp. NBC_01737 TaxID=2975959 RepID=UPI002E14F1C0|nr:hypothetical protein OHA72_46705 [Dactylosporangium sp. NBC_01737]